MHRRTQQTDTLSPRVLAVSSGGGHLAELRRLSPAWDGAELTYVVTEPGYTDDVRKDPGTPDGKPPRVLFLPDANKAQKLRLARLALAALWMILRERPDVVISTGAAPGYFAIRFGKMLGARTIWVDSIANAEEMSVSATLARPFCDLWLTQWPHLARDNGPAYAGTVL
ncbi:hypothetical protein [Aestuariivita boseongensis]|uniref:hypothetical protein n=1 Tax=Aestuariivita boseongensis TaxID=1470562 RepID=UPI00067F98EA|nr:hypothetical protein [Aestuariivita boseongensis]